MIDRLIYKCTEEQLASVLISCGYIIQSASVSDMLIRYVLLAAILIIVDAKGGRVSPHVDPKPAPAAKPKPAPAVTPAHENTPNYVPNRTQGNTEDNTKANTEGATKNTESNQALNTQTESEATAAGTVMTSKAVPSDSASFSAVKSDTDEGPDKVTSIVTTTVNGQVSIYPVYYNARRSSSSSRGANGTRTGSRGAAHTNEARCTLGGILAAAVILL